MCSVGFKFAYAALTVMLENVKNVLLDTWMYLGTLIVYSHALDHHLVSYTIKALHNLMP